MRKLNKIIVGGALIMATVGSGCKKDWFNINQNPNQAVETNMVPNLVMPQALLNTANRSMVSYGFLGNWLGYWCPGANYAPNVEETSYNITTNFNQGLFGGLMDNAYDYAFMENSAVKLNATFYRGVAKIMKSHNFVQLVDLYNDIPYTEALKGIANLRPAYSSGQAVYEDAIKQIDSAIALIKGADISFNQDAQVADIMFGTGKKADFETVQKPLWVKFANTLKLRILMHQAGRTDRAGYIQTEINKIVAEGSGFLGSGTSASVNPGFTSSLPNSYYANFGFTLTGTQATDFWRANVISTDSLKTHSDPRLGYFYKQVVTPKGSNAEAFSQLGPDTYRGNRYGLSINNVQYPAHTANFVSQVGGIGAAGPVTAASSGIIKGFDMRAWILTSVESLFLQAEAIQRGWLAGDPEQAYKNAVKESFLWLNVGGSQAAASTAFDNWYAAATSSSDVRVVYSLAPNKLELLAYQKWTALNGIAFLEAWVDYRRFGNFPKFPLSVNPGRTSSTLPYRLLYPQRELDLNTVNVPQVGRKSGDQFTKVWWMP